MSIHCNKSLCFVSIVFCDDGLPDDGLPIYDSFVVTLLDYYLSEFKNECKKSEWVNYRKYKEAYDLFRRLYKLDGFKYKEIDIFLWTYGKALQEYWKKCGILSFTAPSYIPLDRKQ